MGSLCNPIHTDINRVTDSVAKPVLTFSHELSIFSLYSSLFIFITTQCRHYINFCYLPYYKRMYCLEKQNILLIQYIPKLWSRFQTGAQQLRGTAILTQQVYSPVTEFCLSYHCCAIFTKKCLQRVTEA